MLDEVIGEEVSPFISAILDAKLKLTLLFLKSLELRSLIYAFG